ncbi:MAG TPA: TIM barrel protein [Roseiflexaceae bacterium]|nr:TIM barrel protein [Roseiflexaceae bacterium]
MARIKQSVAWWCFVRGDMTPERLVRTAAEIGYQGIDLAPPEYWPLIREHGLTIAAANGHQSISDGLNRREHHDRIEQELLANIRLAEQWRIANLICFSGDRNGLDDATGLEICAEGLRRVAPAAEAAGVNLSVELLNSKVDHPDYQCDHTDWGVQLVKLVDSPRVALLYDIYHMQIMEGDIIRTIKADHRHFCHYHTAGNPGRHELDDQQELWYPPIMRAIAATGYDGFVAQEFIPRGDPVAALQQAYSVCDVALP